MTKITNQSSHRPTNIQRQNSDSQSINYELGRLKTITKLNKLTSPRIGRKIINNSLRGAITGFRLGQITSVKVSQLSKLTGKGLSRSAKNLHENLNQRINRSLKKQLQNEVIGLKAKVDTLRQLGVDTARVSSIEKAVQNIETKARNLPDKSVAKHLRGIANYHNHISKIVLSHAHSRHEANPASVDLGAIQENISSERQSRVLSQVNRLGHQAAKGIDLALIKPLTGLAKITSFTSRLLGAGFKGLKYQSSKALVNNFYREIKSDVNQSKDILKLLDQIHPSDQDKSLITTLKSELDKVESRASQHYDQIAQSITPSQIHKNHVSANSSTFKALKSDLNTSIALKKQINELAIKLIENHSS